jgi:hypothetical protein
MKKALAGTFLLALAIIVPIPVMAGISLDIRIPLPPPIVHEAAPAVIVLPDTDYVYVVPNIELDIFFWNGWWWREWEGYWYRSLHYSRGWTYYNAVPDFYFDVDPGWRRYYREHKWYGHRWNYEPIPSRRLLRNWKKWNKNRYWGGERNWGVQGYKPRPHQQIQELRHQRQEQYQQRPEVQRHHQQRQERQEQPRVQEQQHKSQVQPLEKKSTITPESGQTGRDEKQQIQPTEKKSSKGSSNAKGKSKKDKSEKKKKSAEDDEDRGSKDEKNHDK